MILIFFPLSGAEGTVIEEPTRAPGLIWGLGDKTPVHDLEEVILRARQDSVPTVEIKAPSPHDDEKSSEETGPTAQFWVESGSVIGVAVNGFAGETTERQRIGGTLEETAEVWLARV